MKKLYASILCAVVIAAMVLSTPNIAFTDDVVPQAGKTGAPSEGTCANTGCHTSSSGGSGNVAMTFSGGNAYSPGVTYNITVTVTDATAGRFGFELTALDASNNKAGNLVITNTATQSMPTSGGVTGRQYIAHKNANASNTWTFDWVAPSTDVGNVTFYYSGNGANNNGSRTGDHIYLGSTAISVNTAVALTGNPQANFFVQTPITNNLQMTYTLAAASAVLAELYDLSGKKVMELERTKAEAGNHVVTKALPSSVTAGLYFARFNANGTVQTAKVLVL
jgi:hypothetical protein